MNFMDIKNVRYNDKKSTSVFLLLHRKYSVAQKERMFFK